VRLTSEGSDRWPAWSPDDRSIAFLRSFGKNSALMLIPSIGGSAHEVAKMDVGNSTLSWSPDGRWLVLSARESERELNGIWRVSVETGERQRMIPPPASKLPATTSGHFGDFMGSLSPDGRVLVFLRSLSTYHYDLYTVRVTPDLQPEGPVLKLLGLIGDYDSITWSGEREIVLRIEAPDQGSLYRMQVSPGSLPQRLTWSRADAYGPTISLSKHRLVYTRGALNANLWRRDLRTGEDRIIIGSSYLEQLPQYSPGDKRIAFQSNRSGTGGLWICEADGENCRQLASFGGSVGGTPRWSPDGRWLAYDSREAGPSQIYVISADGGRPRRLTSGDGDNMIPSWSRDGRWIYFTSRRSGQSCVWKASASGGEAVQVTRSGEGGAFESFDGAFLYFVSARGDAFALLRAPVGGGDEKLVVPHVASWLALAVTAKGAYFLPDKHTVQLFDEKTGQISTVARLGDRSIDFGMTVSADDHYLVFSNREPFHNDLMLVEGFR
jgi:Tol biopolymer transport system component